MKKRIDILNAGKSTIGFTNYKMGAKWHTHNNNVNKTKLLDCSGFVVWAYKMARFNVPDGTYHQWNNSHEISAKELQIGDIGIKEQGGLGMYNHVGIYAGDGRWIHCNYSRNGVTLEKTDIFKFYRRFNNVVFEDDKADVRKEEIEVIEKGKYVIDGKSIEMYRILKDNMQYVKLQDLVKAGVLKAEWDNKTKITKIIK